MYKIISESINFTIILNKIAGNKTFHLLFVIWFNENDGE